MKPFGAVLALALTSAALAQLPYPPTKTVDAADTYFGTTYKDPYRWLEDLKDPAVGAWFKSQAELTDGLLAKIPARDALAAKSPLTDLVEAGHAARIRYDSFSRPEIVTVVIGAENWRQELAAAGRAGGVIRSALPTLGSRG